MSERTKDSSRTAGEGVRRTTSAKSQTVPKKRPPQAQRPAEKRDAGERKQTASAGRRPAERQRADDSAVRKKSAGAGNRQSSTAKKSGASSGAKTRTSSGRPRDISERSRMDDSSRMTSRDMERARRREERLRRVRRQKIIMAASGAVIVLSLLTLLIFFLSPARCIVNLSKGDKFAKNEEYDKALEAYREALEINEKSVKAYRGIAGCLRMQEQIPEAEQILYEGYEKTKDEGILRYYNTLLINDAVADINGGNCTQSTVDKLNRVLLYDPENLDALALLDTCKQRMAAGQPQDIESGQPQDTEGEQPQDTEDGQMQEEQPEQAQPEAE